MEPVEAYSTVSTDNPTLGIAGQLYELGQPVGAEIEIAVRGETVNKLPAVAHDSQGDFLVVWEGADLDGSLHGIFGRRVSGAGSLLGERFQVNSYTSGDQASPWVAADPLGGFVAVWTSHEQDGDQGGIYGQRLAADGSLLGGEFAVNTTTAGHQFLPQVIIEPSGNFMVAWTSEEQDGSGEGVYAQRYTRDGQRLGEEFLVNSTTAGDQRLWALSVDKSGNVSIQWQVLAEDGQPLGVSQQVFDADGNPVGGEEPIELP